jgi:uncharacterized protein (TIGR02284 family)
MADIQKTHDLIHNLIEFCRDSQQAYIEAAEHISDSRLRHYFNERALERAQFAGELTEELRTFGEHHLKTEGSTGGAIRRAWMDVKNKLGGGDHAILSSLESCEDTIKHAYEEVLKAGLPSDFDALLRTQAQSIYNSHDYIRGIRDRRQAA